MAQIIVTAHVIAEFGIWDELKGDEFHNEMKLFAGQPLEVDDLEPDQFGDRDYFGLPTGGVIGLPCEAWRAVPMRR